MKPMKKKILMTFLFYATCCFSGCAAIGMIFKAGVWVGVFIVVAIIALVLFLVNKGSDKN
jgi:hypothetical protein